jgi:hypothetical protein
MKLNSPRSNRWQAARRAWLGVAPVLAFAATFVLLAHPAPARQNSPQQPSEEIVATLSAGHVVWCVTREAILVAAVGGGDEQGSHLPAILPIGSFRMGVLLGAVDWNQGSAGKAVRLDAELPQAVSNATRRPIQTNANAAPDPNEPSEIEQIGVGVLEVLRPLVGQLHRKLDLAPDEPLLELLLADYVENYGPEIWSLKYRIRQDNLGNDYWETRILRPAYYQLYPPEKGSAHTFMEGQYPASLPQLGLVARLAQNDPQIEAIRSASTDIDQAATTISQGHSDKALGAPVADFLRAALPAIAGKPAGLVLAEVDARRGFQWLVPPKEAPPAPSTTQTKPSEPGAPSLRKYIPPPN